MAVISDEIYLRHFGGVRENSLSYHIGSTDDESYEIKTIDHSSYIDHESLMDSLKLKKNNFSIFSVNIQSLNSKFDKLLAMLHDIRNHNYEFSLICLQETWLSDESDLSQFQIDNYTCISQGKLCSEHGGLMIYLHNDFKHKIRKLYKRSNIRKACSLI